MNASHHPAPALPGTHNSRDLGGIAADRSFIRTGVLWRSDAPINLEPEGTSALRDAGIRTAVDLREPFERELHPVDVGGVVTCVNWPLIDGRFELDADIELATLYREIIDHCGERVAGVVEILAGAGGLPAMIFCSAGKDRTGLVAALVLSAVGVDDAEVARDYARSEAALGERFRAELGARAAAAGFTLQSAAVQSGAPIGLIREILALVRARHGGAAGYLLASGLSPVALDTVRDALRTPGSAAAPS